MPWNQFAATSPAALPTGHHNALRATHHMRLATHGLVAALALLPAPLLAQQAGAGTLRVRLDTPAPDSAVSHVTMPPGWHITTGPGALLYDPANSAGGRFAVEAEIFLFPGESQEGHGLFIGGSAIEGDGAPSYLTFLVRRDGGAAVEQHRAGARITLLSLARAEGVTAHSGQGTARNVIRVAVEPDSIRFSANGVRVGALARGDLPADGLFGFRIGKDLNLHISQLDITRRLAPAPARR